MITTKIFSSKKEDFIAFINKKNKKAEKIGCDTIKFSFGKTFVEKASDDGAMVEFIEIFLDESVIKFQGWQFIGIIEEIEGEIFIRAFEDIPHKYRETKFECEHCNTLRHRKSVYIIKNNDEYKAVGKNCLEDFTGHTTASQYASHYQWLLNLDETFEAEEFLGGNSPKVYRVEDILLVAVKSIEDFGFYPSNSYETSGKLSTKDDVISMFIKKKIDWQAFNDGHYKTVQNALEWIKSVEASSDYIFNLQSLVNAQYVNLKHFGYVVSLIPTFYKAMKSKETFEHSQYVGNVGDKKVTFEGVCKGVITFESLYGTQKIHKILCGDNLIIYKTKNHFCNDGDNVKFVGTIKEHSEYKGIKQTVVTRCKIL